MKNKIWLTSKSRIYAEVRFRRYAFVAHIALAWYSLFLICLTIFGENVGLEAHVLSKLSIVLSVALLVGSVVLYGFGFEKTGAQHRECYLKLQRLLADDFEPNSLEMKRKYSEILDTYPNHSSFDFQEMVFDRTVLGRQSLVGENNAKVDLKCGEIFFVVVKKMARWLAFASVFAFPLFASLLPVLV